MDSMELERCVCFFLEKWKEDPNARFRSFDHCYGFFSENLGRLAGSAQDAGLLDALSLHLFSYLASWGMLRGSSFMLFKDYRYLYGAVGILAERSGELAGADTESKIRIALDLKVSMRAHFGNVRYWNQEWRNGRASDTLLSKILLGTLGITVAFDNNVREACSHAFGFQVRFNRDGLERLWRCVDENRELIGRLQDMSENVTGIRYPEMKILDMALWWNGGGMAETEASDGIG